MEIHENAVLKTSKEIEIFTGGSPPSPGVCPEFVVASIWIVAR
ncbi:hypothetical protein SAMN04488052_1157 [Aquisalimonas asiatica]|uniref:Uncharacterized protein n=1 Tax=Aquisalimonas asiatica TaxID=406100 RepID=A0A1H8VSZ2_9GAMM|nr:hypothetical protein SAMN04488052_1157 [Aquisalimonas asiatica]